MNEYNPNNPSEMLPLLLDGELESGREATLFSELARDEELRGELTDILAIRNSVRADSEAFTPPLTTTNKVFSGLGFSAPAPEPVATAANNSGHSRKLWFAALPVIGLLFVMLYPGSSPQSLTVADARAHVASVQHLDNSGVQASSEIITRETSKIATVSKVRQHKVQTAIAPKPAHNTAVSSNENVAEKVSILIPISNSNYVNETILLSTSPAIPSSGNSSEPGFAIAGLPNNMIIQMRGIGSLSETGNFTDFNFSLYMLEIGGINLGIEAGNETFHQQFRSPLGDDNVIYQKTSNLFWLGLAARYQFDSPLAYTFGGHPYLHASVGGASQGQGLIMKCSSGLTYNLFNNIQCVVGIEYGNLEPADKNSKASSRFGITYGLNINL